MTFWILLSLTGFLVLATLAPLWRRKSWWVRMWEFPRLQFALLASVVVVAGLLLLDHAEPTTWLLISAGGFALLYQTIWIAPFSPFWPRQVKDATKLDDANSLRLLNSNVLMTNRNADALVQLVANLDPDVILALETDRWWESQLDVLESDYPHTLKCPLSNLYGMHCYSRLPLEDAEIRFIVEDDVPSMHGKLVLRSGSRVRFHFLHPAPPSPTENAKSVERDGELMRVGLMMEKHSDPVIVCGDLNDVGWSRTTRRFRRVARLFDPRRGRGMYNSFHAQYFFLRWPLDHFFHSEHFFVRQIRRLPRMGSDHFPVLLELQFEPQSANKQTPPTPDKEEKQQARETMKRAADQGYFPLSPFPFPLSPFPFPLSPFPFPPSLLTYVLDLFHPQAQNPKGSLRRFRGGVHSIEEDIPNEKSYRNCLLVLSDLQPAAQCRRARTRCRRDPS